MGLTLLEQQKLRTLRATGRPLQWRAFVHIRQGHNKFWRIATEGDTVYVEYGPIGSTGVSLRKTCLNRWAAADYAGRKIAEKLGKGYEELR